MCPATRSHNLGCLQKIMLRPLIALQLIVHKHTVQCHRTSPHDKTPLSHLRIAKKWKESFSLPQQIIPAQFQEAILSTSAMTSQTCWAHKHRFPRNAQCSTTWTTLWACYQCFQQKPQRSRTCLRSGTRPKLRRNPAGHSSPRFHWASILYVRSATTPPVELCHLRAAACSRLLWSLQATVAVAGFGWPEAYNGASMLLLASGQLQQCLLPSCGELLLLQPTSLCLLVLRLDQDMLLHIFTCA